MSQRKPRRAYKSTIARDRVAHNVINNFPLSEETTRASDYIAISDTIQHISRTSPRDLAYLKSPVKSPRVQLSSTIISSPRIDLNDVPEKSPRSPVNSPIKSPIKSPIRSPVQSPVNSPIKSPVNSPLKSPIKSPIRSPAQSPVNSPIKSPMSISIKSPRLKSPIKSSSKDEIIDLTPNVNNFMKSTFAKTGHKTSDVRSLYDKKVPVSSVATITNLDSETTPLDRGIHKVSKNVNNVEVHKTNNNRDEVEKEVEKIILNNDYKSISSRLPRIENKSVRFTPSPTPKKNDFVPSYGDTFTRNGITYIYDDNGWRSLEVEEPIKVEVPAEVTKTKKSATKDPIFRGIPNYSLLSPEQQIYFRSKFNIKFDMMRETWPQYEIPSLGQEIPLEHIHIMYNHYVKHIYARENAQTYELYMIVGWIAMQAIAVKLLHLPAQGFYKFRANRMGKYRMLLIQLGEKYHGEFGEGWPVEIKILVMSVIEIAIFIILKLLLSLGDDVNESAVSFISDLIDRHFGITGVSSSVSESAGLAIKTPEVATREAKSGIPSINIPSLPEETNDISNITNWFPTIASKLGIDGESNSTAKESSRQENKNAAAERIRNRVASRSKQYSPPPFNN